MLDLLGRMLSDFYGAADLITGIKESFAAPAWESGNALQNDARLGRSRSPVVCSAAPALVLAP
jgi:hypothetical protein